jgi:acyl-coenzyme A synthetase/AMP-(fatty) acid ligase
MRRFFETVGVKALLHAPESLGMLSGLIQETRDEMTSITGLHLSELFAVEPVEHFPFQYTYEQVKDEAFMCVHTSGTSGHPKPIYWTHRASLVLLSPLDPAIRAMDNDNTNVISQLSQGHTMFMPFPLFHVSFRLKVPSFAL